MKNSFNLRIKIQPTTTKTETTVKPKKPTTQKTTQTTTTKAKTTKLFTASKKYTTKNLLFLLLIIKTTSGYDIADRKYFLGAYEGTGSEFMEKAFFLQNNFSHGVISCTDDVRFKKKNGDLCRWNQPNGRSINLNKYSIDKHTCDLIISKALTEDTGTFECMMTINKRLNRDTHRRHVVVYTVPDFTYQMNVTYVTKSCDRKRLMKLQAEILPIFCATQSRDCTYKVYSSSCDGYQKDGAFDWGYFEANTLQATFTIERHLANTSKLPNCDLGCLKRTYIHHLLDSHHKERVARFEEMKEVLYDLTGFVRIRGSTEKVLAYCPGGFFSFKDEVCLPCSSGFYRAPQDPHFRCIPCGYWSFQPKIGQTTCIRCLHYGFSYSDHSDSSLNCIAIYYSWQFVLVLTAFIMLLLFCISSGWCKKLNLCLRCLEMLRVRKNTDPRLLDKLEAEFGEKKVHVMKAPSTERTKLQNKMDDLKNVVQWGNMGMKITKNEAEVVAKNLKNIQHFTPNYDSETTGLTKDYREKLKRKRKYRVDDRDVPEVIKKRQHGALGWTQAYNTAQYK